MRATIRYYDSKTKEPPPRVYKAEKDIQGEVIVVIYEEGKTWQKAITTYKDY